MCEVTQYLNGGGGGGARSDVGVCELKRAGNVNRKPQTLTVCMQALQGHLAHKKPPQPSNLQQAKTPGLFQWATKS